ncbi:MAG: PQQ-binding-like beta-propeller repeat protein [Acidobacteria bacterium]|nr:PQQ-binding-like beta-propeller repeat protein [Acidobacteriota bacterium]
MWNKISVFLFFILFVGAAASPQNVLRSDPASGYLGSPLRKCWSVEAGLRDSGKYASDNNQIIYLTEFNVLKTLDPYSGKPIWSSELGDLKSASIVFGRPILISSRSANQLLEVRTVDNDTGLTLKKTSVDLNNPQFLGQSDNEYLIIDVKGVIYSLNKKDGTLTIAEKPVLAGRLLLDSWLKDMGPENPSVSDIRLLSYISANPAVNADASAFLPDGAFYIIGDSLGTVISSDAERKAIYWKVRLGGAVKSITASENGYLISCLDNFVYLLDRKTGDLLWKRRIDGRPAFNPIIRDGFVILSALGDEFLQIFNLDNGKPVNKIRLDSNSFILGAPLFFQRMLILPTNRGFEGFGVDCK